MLDFLIILSMVLFSVFVAKVLVYKSEQVGTSSTTRYKSYFKKYYQGKVTKINSKFGRGTWKKFIKNDLKETQQVIKDTLSKKTITRTEYSKLELLLDEMETYINNNAQQGSNIELDEEILLLRKINREKVKTRLREMGRIK